MAQLAKASDTQAVAYGSIKIGLKIIFRNDLI